LEISSIEGENAEEIFRYMAPLIAVKPCLKCHEKQGYKEGDIRGGISISFPYNSYRIAAGQALSRIYIFHALFFIICSVLIFFLGRLLVRNISELEGSIVHIERLEGILPICASCKKIKDKNGKWNRVENYIEDCTNAEFSHGLCPDCAKHLYPEQFEKLKNE